MSSYGSDKECSELDFGKSSYAVTASHSPCEKPGGHQKQNGCKARCNLARPRCLGADSEIVEKRSDHHPCCNSEEMSTEIHSSNGNRRAVVLHSTTATKEPQKCNGRTDGHNERPACPALMLQPRDDLRPGEKSERGKKRRGTSETPMRIRKMNDTVHGIPERSAEDGPEKSEAHAESRIHKSEREKCEGKIRDEMLAVTMQSQRRKAPPPLPATNQDIIRNSTIDPLWRRADLHKIQRNHRERGESHRSFRDDERLHFAFLRSRFLVRLELVERSLHTLALSLFHAQCVFLSMTNDPMREVHRRHHESAFPRILQAPVSGYFGERDPFRTLVVENGFAHRIESWTFIPLSTLSIRKGGGGVHSK